MSATRRFRRAHRPSIPGLAEILAMHDRDPARFGPGFHQALIWHDSTCEYPSTRRTCTCRHGPDIQIISEEPPE